MPRRKTIGASTVFSATQTWLPHSRTILSPLPNWYEERHLSVRPTHYSSSIWRLHAPARSTAFLWLKSLNTSAASVFARQKMSLQAPSLAYSHVSHISDTIHSIISKRNKHRNPTKRLTEQAVLTFDAVFPCPTWLAYTRVSSFGVRCNDASATIQAWFVVARTWNNASSRLHYNAFSFYRHTSYAIGCRFQTLSHVSYTLHRARLCPRYANNHHKQSKQIAAIRLQATCNSKVQSVYYY